MTHPCRRATERRWLRVGAIAVATALAAVSPSAAQTLFQGRIDITVQDAQDRTVPGAAVDISGPSTQQQITDADGQAHFLNLAPGAYTVKVTMQGFTPLSERGCAGRRRLGGADSRDAAGERRHRNRPGHA